MLLSSRIVSAAFVAVSLFLPVFGRGAHGIGVDNRQSRQLCTTHLEVLAKDGSLTREAFASLLENLSQEAVHGPYDQLPLKYTAMFNMQACLNGKYCVGDSATISVSTEEERMMTCAIIESSLPKDTKLAKPEETCEATAGNDTKTKTTCDASYPVDLKMGLAFVGK